MNKKRQIKEDEGMNSDIKVKGKGRRKIEESVNIFLKKVNVKKKKKL